MFRLRPPTPRVGTKQLPLPAVPYDSLDSQVRLGYLGCMSYLLRPIVENFPSDLRFVLLKSRGVALDHGQRLNRQLRAEVAKVEAQLLVLTKSRRWQDGAMLLVQAEQRLPVGPFDVAVLPGQNIGHPGLGATSSLGDDDLRQTGGDKVFDDLVPFHGREYRISDI